MKLLLSASALFLLSFGVPSGGAKAQQPPAAAPATCSSQYQDTPATTASLLGSGFNIVAAVQGGVWLQKDREAYFCNSLLVRDGAVICWKVREPVKGQACS